MRALTRAGRFNARHNRMVVAAAPVAPAPQVSRCELRPGIGLCDDCLRPAWPQQDVGYGAMVCLDCLAKSRPQGTPAQ